jgi:hypothetical protein
VVLVYEMRDNSSNPCGVCATGTVVLNANSAVPLNFCAGYLDMCINVVEIGGVAISPACHLHDSHCHSGNTFCGGSITSGNCGGTINWNASWSSATNIFNIN